MATEDDGSRQHLPDLTKKMGKTVNMGASKAFTGSRVHANKMLPKDASPAARNFIWHEHVTKELKHQKLRYDFTCDPRTMTVFPEKEHHQKKDKKWRAPPLADEKEAPPQPADPEWMKTVKNPEADERLKRSLRHDALPQVKYPFPMTAAQEIGWHGGKGLPIKSAKGTLFDHSLKSSDAAMHASAYVLTHGVTPFGRQTRSFSSTA